MCHLNGVDSQSLLIRLLLSSEQSTVQRIVQSFSETGGTGQMKAYFTACASFALARKQRKVYCATFEDTCRAIFAQQTDKAEIDVLKSEYVLAMGWPNNVQFNRIAQGEGYLHVANVMKLCGQFKQAADRRFWRNQILSFFPATQFPPPDQEEETEYETLVFVLERCLTAAEHNAATAGFTQPEKEKLESVARPAPTMPRPDPLGEPPYRLYAVIERLLKARHISVEELVIDELQTTMQSWYTWKPKWEKAEKEGFEKLPKPRIARKYLLAIAVICGLTYLDMIRLLQLGGYRLGQSRIDQAVAEAFIRGKYDKDELKQYILNEVP